VQRIKRSRAALLNRPVLGFVAIEGSQKRSCDVMIARRFIVRGRVQGVGYRYFAVRAARTLGLVGSVRNLPDGTVEAIAQGSADAIARFKTDLERGPSFSGVAAVDEYELPPSGRFSSFDVSY